MDTKIMILHQIKIIYYVQYFIFDGCHYGHWSHF